MRYEPTPTISIIAYPTVIVSIVPNEVAISDRDVTGDHRQRDRGTERIGRLTATMVGAVVVLVMDNAVGIDITVDGTAMDEAIDVVAVVVTALGNDLIFGA